MAPTKTLAELSSSHNSLKSRHGVVTLFGHGIKVCVDRGHLQLEDGIGAERQQLRLPRIGHNLRLLVVVSCDGYISFAALQWLADQKAAFVMLERDGSVLATVGPVHSSDVRLRRAQALATQSDTALRIALELIDKKLEGQEQVARHKLLAPGNANRIRCYRSELAEADSIEQVRSVEAAAAIAYWSAWRSLPITFPRKDEQRVPDHWRIFGARMSPLTNSPRLAINPPNALLNYAYSVLESECTLAAAAVGLDAAMGVLHLDKKGRNSLSCDLAEPIRPFVDGYVFDFISRDPLKRDWFFEQRDGSCRLMASLAIQLSQTAPMWRRAVAPFAEWVAQKFWTPSTRRDKAYRLPTRLTQRHKREAKGADPLPPPVSTQRRENLCRGCGKTIGQQCTHCRNCAKDGWSKHMVNLARVGRLTANSPEAQAKRRSTQRRNHESRRSWDQSSQPSWLTEQFFSERIQPVLAQTSGRAIARTIGVSYMYGTRIRRGYRPHPRHWQALASLAGIPDLNLDHPKQETVAT